MTLCRRSWWGAWLMAKPLALVPGSSMTYDGVSEARDRGDLIAYLKLANASAACRVP